MVVKLPGGGARQFAIPPLDAGAPGSKWSARQGPGDAAVSVSIHRLRKPSVANEGIAGALDPTERAAMIGAAASKLEELFDILQIDHRNDHNTRDTPRRVAEMFVNETLHGRYCEPPALTEFDNRHGFDQLIVTGPVDIRSTCAHHLMPIYGHAFIGILPAPEGRIIGLSKYDRVAEHFASRPQVQEELVKQIGDYLMKQTAPRGLAVRINAVHMCKTQRGVRASHRSRMVSSAYWGEFQQSESLKDEFLQECIGLERGAM
jgi:GTP cyclohydrolase I